MTGESARGGCKTTGHSMVEYYRGLQSMQEHLKKLYICSLVAGVAKSVINGD